jgi:hypothetical protein
MRGVERRMADNFELGLFGEDAPAAFQTGWDFPLFE